MKKITTGVAGIVLPLLLIITVSSCQKETTAINGLNEEIATAANNGPITRAYRDSFDTWYQFVPDIAGGWTPPNPAPAWYPGGGDGNATHFGIASSYFNQYASFGPTGLTSSAAPVTMFFAAQLASFSVPSNVSTIVFDDKGNSVWFQSAGTQTMPVSPTRVNFTGTNNIVGGTGKFAGATGEVTINGYFNPQNQQDASFWQNGWIRY
jgi:hypothetical protein